MIGFSCTNCDHTISVQDEYLGKRIKCPKCNFVGVVIDDSGRIKITCQNCGNENNVPENIDDKEIKCPKCNNPVYVPPINKEPAEIANNNQNEKKPETHVISETTERSLIIIISAIAAFIVIGLIFTAIIAPSYKSRKARKIQASQKQQQINNTLQTKKDVQDSGENILKLRDTLKWEKSATIYCAIVIPILVLLFCYIYWCPNCRKMWAMKRITTLINSSNFREYECKYCGHTQRI